MIDALEFPVIKLRRETEETGELIKTRLNPNVYLSDIFSRVSRKGYGNRFSS